MTKKFLVGCLAHQAYQFRDEPFTLKSGQESQHYVDCRPLLLDHHFSRMFAETIAGHARWTFDEVGFVAGVVLGGCSPALGVGRELGEVPVIFVRPEPKTHGARDQLVLPASIKEDPRPREGILVEDVITTGGSSLAAMGVLKEAGFEVKAVYCIVNRSGRVHLAGATVYALTTLEELIAVRKASDL